MTEASDELRQMRRAAGYRSARAAAMAMGIPIATYSQHENGARPFGIGQSEAYGIFFIGVRLIAAQLHEQRPIPDPETLAATTYDTLHRARHWRDASPERRQAYKDALESAFRTFGINLPETAFRPASGLPGAI